MNSGHAQPPLRSMVGPNSASPASRGSPVAAGAASGVVWAPAQRSALAGRSFSLLPLAFRSRSSAMCCRIITRSARPSAHSPSRHSPLAPCPGPISNLKSEISNPLRLLPSSVRLSSLTLVNIGSSAMCCRIITRSARPSAHAPSRHSPLAPCPGPISNLKSEFSNPFCLLPSTFSLSQDPSPFPKDPSFKPEYPPLSRNIPPYPRISPPPVLVRNQFQHNHIRPNTSNALKTPSLIINHLRAPTKATAPGPPSTGSEPTGTH